VNRRNSEGYSDPTAYLAMKKIEETERRANQLRRCISAMCELAGFSIQGKLILVDKRDGEVWK